MSRQDPSARVGAPVTGWQVFRTRGSQTAMQVSFGEFVLDFDSRELRRGSHPVRLSPKALQLLQILVAERPKALSKPDLQNRLWPDTFVVEKNLANLISEIREALGEDPVDPRFIRTVPRYGYAFREPAVEIDGTKAAVSPHVSPWRVAALALAAAGLITLAGYAAWALLVTPPSTVDRRIMLRSARGPHRSNRYRALPGY